MSDPIPPNPPEPMAEAFSAAEQRFETWRRRIGFFLAPAAGIAVYALTRDVDFIKSGAAAPSIEQARLLSGILAFVCVMWLTESLPLPITALLGAALCVLFGVAGVDTVLAQFADKVVFLFIGSFILAEAMMLHRLDRRVALSFLSIPFLGANPFRILCGLGLITAIISMWVSNTATAAMMLPIALGILSALADLRKNQGEANVDVKSWPFATGMMLMVAYAAGIGGIVTPVGSPPNLICIGQLDKQAGIKVTFLQWIQICLPIFAVMFVVLCVLLYAMHPARKRGEPAAPPGDLSDYLRRQREALGGWTRGQINTLVAFGVAVVLWVGPSFLNDPAWIEFAKLRLPESVAALIAAVLLFVLPINFGDGKFTLSWKEAGRIDWGTILLFGGGLSLGNLMFTTGVAETLGRGINAYTGAQTLWGITAAAIVMGIVVSETTSNTAAATMIVPVVITLAHGAGVSPIPPALGAALGASHALMLPVSTPPNAIVYGSGLVPITRMVRAGFFFDFLGFFVILGGLRIICPLLGMTDPLPPK